MVNIRDLKKLMDDFFIEEDENFREIKRYLLSEFKWKVDPLKNAEFMIRGIPIEDNRKISDILNSFLPDEVIDLKEI